LAERNPIVVGIVGPEFRLLTDKRQNLWSDLFASNTMLDVIKLGDDVMFLRD
jgi:hypothetical protein